MVFCQKFACTAFDDRRQFSSLEKTGVFKRLWVGDVFSRFLLGLFSLQFFVNDVPQRTHQSRALDVPVGSSFDARIGLPCGEERSFPPPPCPGFLWDLFLRRWSWTSSFLTGMHGALPLGKISFSSYPPPPGSPLCSFEVHKAIACLGGPGSWI